MRLFIGLMSGTSMDGIDAALVDVDTNTLIAGITRPYSADAQQRLQVVLCGKPVGIEQLSQLNTVLGREFAYAVHQLLETAAVAPAQVIAIGSHGQTIYHDATADIPYTVQLGCAHTIAVLTGIQVVADFRTRDLVMGGQGAPFAPVYHHALFGASVTPKAVINIGGVANVTFLAQDTVVSGYDTGPGNCLMDAWTQKHLQKPYDANGAWAATGHVIEPMLIEMMTDPYFNLPAPKSLDKAYFSLDWLTSYLCTTYASQDIQATLLAFTAASICLAIKANNVPVERVAICGGGVHNAMLLDAIRVRLLNLQVVSSQVLGVDPDFLEAMMFAWLADKTIRKIPVDLTRITGASRASILGAVYAG